MDIESGPIVGGVVVVDMVQVSTFERPTQLYFAFLALLYYKVFVFIFGNYQLILLVKKR